jgi:hypothetical protein
MQPQAACLEVFCSCTERESARPKPAVEISRRSTIRIVAIVLWGKVVVFIAVAGVVSMRKLMKG